MIESFLKQIRYFKTFKFTDEQEVTRSNKGWALDNVVLRNEVTRHMKDQISAPPQRGVFVHGLYLEGAGWDRVSCRLVEAKPKVLVEPLPVILMDADNGAMTEAAARNLYSCPIYKKPRRTNLTYISSVDLRCGVNPDHWTMRGVALLCDFK